MKLPRLIAVTMLLLTKDKMTAKELAERFEVSVRTIHRDMEELNLAGIPITAYQGVGGGYSIMDTYKIDKNFLSKEELLVMRTLLSGMQGSVLDDESSKILSKFDVANLQEDIENPIVMDFCGWSDPVYTKRIFTLLKESIEQQKCVEFTYVNNNCEVSKRVIHPYKLLYKTNSWYVHGFCTKAGEFRVFKILRMKDLEMLPDKFEKRDFDSNGVRRIINFDRQSTLIHMVFEERALNRLFDYFGSDSMNFLDDGRVEVKISYPLDEWVYFMILSFGDSVEVISPKEVREEILKRIRSMESIYKT